MLAEARRLRRDDGDSEFNPYVDELVSGVVGHQGRIDDVLSTYSLGWTLERMPGVDRAIQIARSGNPDRRRTEIHRRVSGRRD